MPRWELPGWARWGGVRLADPSGPPAEDPAWARGPGVIRRLGERWRWWMLVPLVFAALLAMSVVPVDRDLVYPGDVVSAEELLRMTVPAERDPGPVNGAWLMPRRVGGTTALGWLGARWTGGTVVAPAAPQVITFLDPLESAMLTGAGVAPARSSAEQMGLVASLEDPRTPRASLGLLLHAYDRVSAVDVAAGRRILALGVLDEQNRLRCPSDVRASLDAVAPPPDLVVVGRSCPGAEQLRQRGLAVVESDGFPDVLFEVADRSS